MNRLKLFAWTSIFFLLSCNVSTETYTQQTREISNHENISHTTDSNISVTGDTSLTEIVFCLDATGSMSGLIGTAKEKIWSIVTELVQDTSTNTQVKLGMVFYRDRGDRFVTKHIQLTEDIDSVYHELLMIQAEGGGDTPESVNQGLYEAITQNPWSTNRNVYKAIFVVGDCPPHMDYQDDVKYTESCVLAAEKGIVINTIKLGNTCKKAITHFKKMAECSNGNFLQLSQHAQDIVIATPFDDEIYRLDIITIYLL